jgi:very-short-patch-repair endonuclease
MEANPTLAEEAMWKILEPLGFARQYVFTGVTKNGLEWSYILDFAIPLNPDVMLCVEIDGGIHKRQRGRDRRRDTRLAGEGIKTIRFTNREVLKDPSGIGFKIKFEMENRG